MKRFREVWLALVLCTAIIMLSVSGCGGNSSNATGDKGKTSASQVNTTFKVGLLVPNTINDGGWSTSGYEGLKQLEKDMGAEISYMEVKSPSDVVEGFTDYGNKGYNIVFGHSYDYQDAAKRVAPQFPKTIYITSGGTTVMDNVSPIYFQMEQAVYLMGVVAATWTKTGKVGAIGSVNMPAITKTLKAFAQGAKDTNPSVEVVTTYLGTQTDVGKAREAALAMINSGVDFFWVSANAAGQGVYEAVEQSKAKGIKTFGAYSRFSQKYPDTVVADALLDMGNAFELVAKQVKDGTWKPGTLNVGVKEGVVKFFWNEKMYSNIPQNVKDAYEKAKKDLMDGKIKIDIGAY
ncbi:Purine-binding protein [Neomoorella glycerini]|uniref:Purine-binding protein n=1 Tax=Neomoorella glycerini TaxID=55779 RepID=A0A6I5ZRW4_9FIRM|nr:BMP family protein [Moorella glycerini]QGP92580.1 Purine-binding protein [Moorella glycerini]